MLGIKIIKDYLKNIIITIILLGIILLSILFTPKQKVVDEQSKDILISIRGDVNVEGDFNVPVGLSVSEVINSYCSGIKNVDAPNIEITITNPSIKPFSKININNATIDELQTIPGIGKSKAEKIINYRETVKLFSTIEELENVNGFGKASVDKIRQYITI